MSKRFNALYVGYAPRRHSSYARWCAFHSFLVCGIGCFTALTAAFALELHTIYASADWDLVLRAILSSSLRSAFYLRGGLAALVAAVSAAIAYRTVWENTPEEEPFRTLKSDDPKLFYDEFARDNLSRCFRDEARNDGAGLWLAPHLRLPFSLEPKGIMIIGAPNSGKSNIVRALAEQAIERGDRVLLHCNKGDVTQSFSSRESILIAAHHRDSYAWDIAADVSDPAAAAQFASDIIPRSDNPFWSETARILATDDIISLIGERGTNWDARELVTRLISDPALMADRIKNLDLNASPILLAGEENGLDKTIMGVMSTLWSGVYTTLRPMAYAWTGFPPQRRFSVKRWLSADYAGPRTVIVQTSPEYDEVSTAIAGGLIKRVATRLADPSLSSSTKRRVVLALDEMHVLKRIDRMETALALGREKGLVPIVALQSLSQLTGVYGSETADTISDLFQIKIYGRLVAGAGADLVEKRLGKRFVSAFLDNRTPARDDRRKYIEHRSEEALFSATRLQRDLGVVKKAGETDHVRALVHCYGNGYLLKWPMTHWRKLREGYVPAPWLQLSDGRPQH
ncbi:type IV secretion system DNA-binding domain-containing protein [Bradyrhizobium diazoefficiens]|uniref:type IV secretion system DNA-binding domain-containing protein n=1 Tax=Bradyrhizobium diazoefficiens TaxID=1355477 RepID=UPI00359A4752